ncbi:pantetheine-phosphate adenylyltransferase [Ornithinimicrobium pratense]|uniref:Phosphopantetheine adenylyltransferase n=1 Tax=Ornithinimicrobium pratense TaxID=2593973 RepID=A0A5J6V790_9MICO|nr:pantetheine-phosphate adenylyltransferase [Ornithinimicrobium pratense]QFG68991.1 pantetheine-phosphate adenylyltransferase [Ornithinimicrobium pratense]
MTPTRRCVCPGSFDPVTHGHLDIIARATTLFEEVVVAILHNPAKRGTFEVPRRVAMVQQALPQELADRVRVESFGGQLLVDVCRQVDAGAIVKGLRGGTDFAYELPMALMNKHLTGVETVFLAGDPSLEHVSSSLVKEVHQYGGDVSALVPAEVLAALDELG